LRETEVLDQDKKLVIANRETDGQVDERESEDEHQEIEEQKRINKDLEQHKND
jgi:hypothetical protein